MTALRAPALRPYADLLRRNRDFRRAYLATLVSLGGDWFALIPLLNLLARETGSGLWGGLVLGAETALTALLSPYAGSLVDRLDRRRVLITCDVACAALIPLLLLVRGPSTAWVALVVMGGLAAAKAFTFPASSAALPNLVDPADLPAANVLTGSAWGVMLAVGAALGGVFDSVLGPQTCFLLDSASFAVSAALLALIRRPFQERVTGGRPRMREDMSETAAYVRTHPQVAALVTVKSAVGLGNGTLALFPLLTTSFGVGPVGTGLFFAARGLGALLGPLAVRPFSARPDLRWSLLVGGMALYGLAYLAFAATPWFLLGLLLVVVAHVGGGANWVSSSYALQDCVPDALRGRVFALDFMLATLAVSASQVVGGVLSGALPTRPLVAAFGCVTLAYAALWWLLTRRVRSAVEAPS